MCIYCDFLFLTQSTSQRRKTPQPVRKKTLKTQTLKEFIFIDFLVCILRHWSDKSCKNNLRLNKCVCRALKLFQRRPGRCEVVIQKLSKFVATRRSTFEYHGGTTISGYRHTAISQYQDIAMCRYFSHSAISGQYHGTATSCAYKFSYNLSFKDIRSRAQF